MLDHVSPFSEEVDARFAVGSTADMDRAVAAARVAFDTGPWPRMSLDERIAVMQRLSALLVEAQDDVARLVSAEMGCPVTLSKGMQSIGTRMLLDSFIDLAPGYWRQELRQSVTGNGLVLREPVGVVAAIIPWNAPMLIAMIKLAPALLMGCTAVLKPALETPFDSQLLAELATRAGVRTC